MVLDYLVLVPLSYLIGAMPWGYILVKVTKGVDVRNFGSGKTGMSNVLRTAGVKVALAVVTLDTSKGVLAVLLARLLTDSPVAEVVAGLVAVVGHNWPVFLGFKGGRGLTVAGGATIPIAPIPFLLGCVTFITVTFATRYVSLASILTVIVAFVSLTIMAFTGRSEQTYFYYILFASLLVLWQHRDNMVRLAKGTERKLGQRAEVLTAAGSKENGQ